MSHPKLHLDWFSRFSMDHKRDQQTDKHIDRSCYSICSNRPHLTIAAMQPKALSTPATMSKQHCRMLQVKQFFPQSRMLILNFVIPTKSKQIKHVQFAYTLSKGLNYIKKLVPHRCQKRQQCRSNVRLCRRSNIQLCSIRQCCFDTTAGVDGV